MICESIRDLLRPAKLLFLGTLFLNKTITSTFNILGEIYRTCRLNCSALGVCLELPWRLRGRGQP